MESSTEVKLTDLNGAEIAGCLKLQGYSQAGVTTWVHSIAIINKHNKVQHIIRSSTNDQLH